MTNNNPIVDSLPFYDGIVKAAQEEQSIQRKGNLQILPAPAQDQEKGHEEIAVCNLAVMLGFYHDGNFKDVGSAALAAHHLNTGNGSIVQDVSGLPDRCNIRFTTEYIKTLFSPIQAINEVIKATERDDLSNPICTFIGAQASSVSIPTSIIAGLRGYPQLSGFSTSPELNNANQYPMFGRTIPADDGIALPVIQHYQSIGVEHLAVVYTNDAYGAGFSTGLFNAALEYAPNMDIKSIDVANTDESINRAIDFLKESEYQVSVQEVRERVQESMRSLTLDGHTFVC